MENNVDAATLAKAQILKMKIDRGQLLPGKTLSPKLQKLLALAPATVDDKIINVAAELGIPMGGVSENTGVVLNSDIAEKLAKEQLGKIIDSPIAGPSGDQIRAAMKKNIPEIITNNRVSKELLPKNKQLKKAEDEAAYIVDNEKPEAETSYTLYYIIGFVFLMVIIFLFLNR